MKFTLAWLKDHLDIEGQGRRRSPRRLTRIGLEVEEVFDPACEGRAVPRREVVKARSIPTPISSACCAVDTG